MGTSTQLPTSQTGKKPVCWLPIKMQCGTRENGLCDRKERQGKTPKWSLYFIQMTIKLWRNKLILKSIDKNI